MDPVAFFFLGIFLLLFASAIVLPKLNRRKR